MSYGPSWTIAQSLIKPINSVKRQRWLSLKIKSIRKKKWIYSTWANVYLLCLITRLTIFLVICHSFLACLFCYKKILRVNLVFRMALPVSSASWSTTRQRNIIRIWLRASIPVMQSSSTTHITHWSKYSKRKRTSLMISNRKSFPFLSSRRHSLSVWNNCIPTTALYSKHSVLSNWRPPSVWSRRGRPLVPAYSITTHKSRGQTLTKIIIDLNRPPGMVEVASSYVPLSRVKQLADIAILRDFDISALRIIPSMGQTDELSRFSALFEKTRRRYSHYFT